ncbi:hypothetical protein NCC49_006104 [Naganishia albida]|nr:hypothetical protein NCC49_006104 [Naganishia albida]
MLQSPLTTTEFPDHVDLLTVTIQQLRDHLRKGAFTSVQLVQEYLRRIERDNHRGLELGAVIEVAPYDKLVAIANDLDTMRKQGNELSGLHGIPILVKDSIATHPELGMQTTAGSHALAGSIVPGDAVAIKNLRAAGAIILGKANMKELSGVREEVDKLWSGRGGKCYSAYVEKGDPWGSSNGSAVAVSAGFAAAALGGDTTGSITFPAQRAACYGMRPTLGLVSTEGCVPVCAALDVVGPLGKSAYDVALVLQHMVNAPGKPASNRFTSSADKSKASFKGKRLGVPRAGTFDNLDTWHMWGHPESEVKAMQNVFDEALCKMHALGALLQDPTDLKCGPVDVWGLSVVMTDHELRELFRGYISTLDNCKVESLSDLIRFNEEHPDLEMPDGPLHQASLLRADQAEGTSSKAYQEAIAEGKHTFLSAKEEVQIYETGMGALLDGLDLDAVVVPAAHRNLVVHASLGGLPVATVPLGTLENGAPFGLCFIGRWGSEAILFSLMAAFEANFPARAIPERLQAGQRN